MKQAEAEHLAGLLQRSWPGQRTLSLDVWAEELIDLDAPTVGTLIVRLRRERDHPPTLRQFLDEYRGLDTGSQRDAVRALDCPRCDNTGFVADDDHVIRLNDGTERRDTTVVPCDCWHGERVAPGYRRTVHAVQDDRARHREVPRSPVPDAVRDLFDGSLA